MGLSRSYRLDCELCILRMLLGRPENIVAMASMIHKSWSPPKSILIVKTIYLSTLSVRSISFFLDLVGDLDVSILMVLFRKCDGGSAFIAQASAVLGASPLINLMTYGENRSTILKIQLLNILLAILVVIESVEHLTCLSWSKFL